jgi:predicted nucleotidyltransferase
MKQPPLEKLKDTFKNFPEIMAVYLFGSAATGRIHDESDIDLAIVPRDRSLALRRLDILSELAKEGFCNIDLVILPEDDIVLQYEAIRQNRLIYQKPEFESGTYYSRVIRKYLDFMPYLNTQRKAYKDRILNGAT